MHIIGYIIIGIFFVAGILILIWFGRFILLFNHRPRQIKNAEDEDLTVKVGDTVTVDVQDSNLATRGDIESAESNIIAAMPEIPEFHCNYTPPSESK